MSWTRAWTVAAVAVLSSVSAAPASDLESDLKLMMELFEGEFDNFQQVWGEMETEAEHPHERIHSVFAPVTLPAIGEHVFYVKQYMDGDVNNVYRQRLYRFTPNETEGAIQLDILSFPEDEPYIDAHLEPAKLGGITEEAMRALPGCEVYWRRDGEAEAFKGTMKEGACRIQSQRSGKTIIISDDLLLNRDEIWIRDEAVDEDGNYVFGHKGGEHHKLKRVRFFTGWAGVLKEGTEDDWDFVSKLRIHDQGGKTEVSSGGKTYEVELSQLVYQNTTVPVMKLALYEKGTERAFTYAWANPDSKRLGINLRWMQTGWTLEEDER